MAGRFQDQVVFITGASSGIGAELGKAFAREGAKIALTARRADRLEQVKADIEGLGGQALTIEADVTNRASLDAAVAKTVETFGGIDVAVANAGFGVMGLFAKLSAEDFRRQFNTNVYGVVDTIYAVLPHLQKSKGRLAIVSSVAGRVSTPRSSMYCASKFALCGLADALYHEFDDLGISVTQINPGFVATEIHQIDNEGVYRADRKGINPPALTMPADKAARQMVNAVYRRKPEAIITFHGKFFVFLARHFPGLVRAMQRFNTRGKLQPRERNA